MFYKLSQAIQKQQFYPDILGIFVNPFYFTRHELLKNIQGLAPQIQRKTLDIGCGSKPYEKIFTAVTQYIGMDFDSPEKRNKTKADVFYDGKHFPFEDQSFDSAISTEVLEHIFNPDVFLKETSRVLKKGGYLLLTTPFVWDEHEQPFDYARYSSFGLQRLLESHGFEVLEQRKTADDLRVIFQLINCYIYKIIPSKNYKVRLLFYAAFCAPITIIGLIVSTVFPNNNDLYLSNIVLAKKI